LRSSRREKTLISFVLPLALSITVLAGIPPSARALAGRVEATGISYALLPGGILHSLEGGGLVALPIKAGVERFVVEDGIVYYVRVENGNAIAGRWGRGEAGASELSMEGAGSTPLRLRGSGGTLYVLYRDGDSEEGVLRSADFNGERVLERRGVIDFTLYRGLPVLLERSDGELRCVLGEVRTALVLTGKARFLDAPDPRIIFVSDGERTEVIDAATARTVYRYADGVRYRSPGAHNLEIEAIDDTPGPPSGRMIFYKIFINGVEAGRTGTGPAETRRVFRHSVVPGEYIVVVVERWELNMKRERYERANNILQPEHMRLYVPEGLVLRVLLSSDGRAYRVTAGPSVEPASE
jgi:hypothetical protein